MPELNSDLSRLQQEVIVRPQDIDDVIFWMNRHGLAAEAVGWVKGLPPDLANQESIWRAIAESLTSIKDWKMLEEVRLLSPKIRIGILTEGSIDEALAFAKKTKAFSINPNYSFLSRENVALMQEKGFEVYPWTVNSTEDIQKIKSFNVNGIISDFPDRI